MPTETSYALLGALIALAIVLLVIVIFVGTLASRLLRYAGKFKGFQAGRNAQHEMTFTAKIDESPTDEDGYRISEPPGAPDNALAEQELQ